MAKLLEEEFGHHLVSEDLEAWQRRAHLPSPADLKYKILLKDSFHYQRRDQDGESPSLPETHPSPTASLQHACPPQPTSAHASSGLSLLTGMSLSTSLPPPLLRGASESLGRGLRTGVTFDIPESEDHFRKHKQKRVSSG